MFQADVPYVDKYDRPKLEYQLASEVTVVQLEQYILNGRGRCRNRHFIR